MAVKRVISHGNIRWRARVSYQGTRRVEYHLSRDAAKDAEVRLYQAVRAEADAAARAGGHPATLRQLLDLYVADLSFRRKSPATVARAQDLIVSLERVLPVLLDRPVSQIGSDDVLAFVAARERAGKVITEVVAGRRVTRRVALAAGTINREVTTFRAAVRRVRPDFRVPVGAVSPSADTRVRWLRPEEELTVLEPMPSPFREIAKLAALTLMRLSEIRTLRRAQVHLEQGVLELPTTKTDPRYVILSTAAQTILQAQLAAHPVSEWVFPNPDGRPYGRNHISAVFRRAARAAGLRDFHFHDLRHHGATVALNRGFTASVVMALGGWKTERMMRRYASVTDRTLRAAAEAVSGAAPSAWANPAPLDEAYRVPAPGLPDAAPEEGSGPETGPQVPRGSATDFGRPALSRGSGASAPPWKSGAVSPAARFEAMIGPLKLPLVATVSRATDADSVMVG